MFRYERSSEMSIEILVILVLLANFFYLISVGIVYLFLYINLLKIIYLHGIQDIRVKKYLKIFKILNIFPTATLCIIIVVSLFHIEGIKVIFLSLLSTNYENLYETIMFISSLITWVIPAILLTTENKLSNKKYFCNLFTFLYGVLAILILNLIYSVRKTIITLLL